MRRFLLFIPVLAALLVSCDDGTVVAPEPELGRHHFAAGPIVVMSRNLYLGADIDLLLDPTANLPDVLAGALAQVLYTDFPVRATALAREIHDRAPHLVGLQEVTSYAVTTADGTVVPAFGFPLDFLTVLQAELAALGDDYVVAQRTANVSLTFPLGDLAPIPDLFITYADADAILVRGDVPTWNPQGGQFPTQQFLAVGGLVFANKRGYAAVDAKIDGRRVRFATAHLEIQLFKDVQEQQARELADILDHGRMPVILVGDFNSAANRDAPEESRTRSYHILRRAGFDDLWRERRHRRADGLTCCQLADLSNPTSLLDQRLDLVLVRWGRDGFDGRSRMEIIGEETDDLIDHPAGYTLWPSDHAGWAAWIWPGR